MNHDIEAAINNHDTLVYNAAFTAEMAFLIDGPEKARAKFQSKKLWRSSPKFAEATSEAAKKLFAVPAGAEGRYRRALALVRAIGRAAGEELNEVGHEGELDHLHRIFREGMTSNSKRQIVGSNVEKAFFECGLGAGTILFLVRKPESTEGVRRTINDGAEAFRKGLLEWEE